MDVSDSWIEVETFPIHSDGLHEHVEVEIVARVKVEAVGQEWGTTYEGTITVGLDDVATQVRVQLHTKPAPAPSARHRAYSSAASRAGASTPKAGARARPRSTSAGTIRTTSVRNRPWRWARWADSIVLRVAIAPFLGLLTALLFAIVAVILAIVPSLLVFAFADSLGLPVCIVDIDWGGTFGGCQGAHDIVGAAFTGIGVVVGFIVGVYGAFQRE